MSYSLLNPEMEPQFNSGAVNPFQCLGEGGRLIKGQYFLFVAMCLIIVVLVSCFPFTGKIYGAWMAGIFSALIDYDRVPRTRCSQASSSATA